MVGHIYFSHLNLPHNSPTEKGGKGIISPTK